MNRRLLAVLSLSAIALTGCNNVSSDSNPSTTSTQGASNAVESGIKLQEKAKKAGQTLEQDPLAGQDVPELK